MQLATLNEFIDTYIFVLTLIFAALERAEDLRNNGILIMVIDEWFRSLLYRI